MVELERIVRRKSRATVFSNGQRRRINIILEPSQKIALQLENTRQKYRIDPEVLYGIVVRMYLERVERLAQKIRKNERLNIRSARSRARKELKGELA